jgi:hypothetical protein
LTRLLRYTTYFSICFFALSTSVVGSTAHLISTNSITKVLLCTSQGTKWVTISELEQTKFPDGSRQINKHCSLCLLNQTDVDKYITGNVTLSINPLSPNHPLINVRGFFTNKRLYSLNLPRAPPQFT